MGLSQAFYPASCNVTQRWQKGTCLCLDDQFVAVVSDPPALLSAALPTWVVECTAIGCNTQRTALVRCLDRASPRASCSDRCCWSQADGAGTCQACAAGTTNPYGDDPSANTVTECDDAPCPANAVRTAQGELCGCDTGYTGVVTATTSAPEYHSGGCPTCAVDYRVMTARHILDSPSSS